MSGRGFAAMPADQRKAIASKGGRAAHAKGVGHEFTSDEASAAGKRGGARVSADRAHMAEIGRKGGTARAAKARAKRRAEAEPSFHGEHFE